METTAKAIPKFEIPSLEKSLEPHRHQQTENKLKEKGISFNLQFLPVESIDRGDVYQVRTIEKSVSFSGEKSAHLSEKIFSDIQYSFDLDCVFPAITVIKNLGKTYTVIDGRHRLAVLSKHKGAIPVYVIDNLTPEGDCRALALILNDIHGAPNDTEDRRRTTTKEALNWIHATHHQDGSLGVTNLIAAAAKMFDLKAGPLKNSYDLDESERLMRRAGASEAVINSIGSTLKRSITLRLRQGDQGANLCLVKAIANSGLESKKMEAIIRASKDLSNLEISNEINKVSIYKENGKVKSAGEAARDLAADRLLQTISGALALLKGKNPKTTRLHPEQKQQVKEDLIELAAESARWSRLFKEDADE